MSEGTDTDVGPVEDDGAEAAERRPVEKAPDAYRTISEVAEALDVPQHVLRFWETKFTQVKPLKRAGGRRYYRPDDVVLLQGIRQLLYGEGYTLRGVQRILREKGVRSVKAIGDGQGEGAEGGPAASPAAAVEEVGTAAREASPPEPAQSSEPTQLSDPAMASGPSPAPEPSRESGAPDAAPAQDIVADDTPARVTLSASTRARLEDALRSLDRAEAVLVAQLAEPDD